MILYHIWYFVRGRKSWNKKKGWPLGHPIIAVIYIYRINVNASGRTKNTPVTYAIPERRFLRVRSARPSQSLSGTLRIDGLTYHRSIPQMLNRK